MYEFTITGSFTEKPKLMLNGEDVEYDSLEIVHLPEARYKRNKCENEDGVVECETEEEVVPAYTSLAFSLKKSIGPIEANCWYRVKAGNSDKLILEKTDVKPKKI